MTAPLPLPSPPFPTGVGSVAVRAMRGVRLAGRRGKSLIVGSIIIYSSGASYYMYNALLEEFFHSPRRWAQGDGICSVTLLSITITRDSKWHSLWNIVWLFFPFPFFSGHIWRPLLHYEVYAV